MSTAIPFPKILSRAGAVSALALFLSPAWGATIAVNNAADNEIAGNGQCTLREAVNNANGNADTTGGDCAAGEAGLDVITVGPVVYPLATELAITDILTITGSGNAILDGQSNSRIINNTSTLTLNNLVLRNGVADGAGNPANSGGAILNGAGGVLTVNGGAMNNNTSVRAGGAIEEASGAAAGTVVVTLNNVNFSGNDGGDTPGNGGVLHVTGAGDITINGGTMDSNTAQEGGALWNGAGTMLVDGSVNPVVISNNTATCAATVNGPTGGPGAGGGGVFNIAGTLTVMGNTTISGNNASGAVCSGGGINTFTDTTLNVLEGVQITGNTANRAGGGIESNPGSTTTLTGAVFANNTANTTGTDAGGNGGALHITGDGDADITGGSFDSNTAAAEGGALWNGAGSMTVVNASITNNTANGGTADAGDADAQGGGGIFNEAGTVTVSAGTEIRNNSAAGDVSSGGGIFSNEGTTLNLTEGVIIATNTANRAGGGIELRDGVTASLLGFTLENNTTNTTASGGGGNGGGLHVTGDATVDISDASIVGNVAATEGGGLWNNSGTMNVFNSTLRNNTGSGDLATNGGGAIFNNGGAGAGTVLVSNSRLINNTANGTAGSGGGILNLTGTTTVTGGVIAGNQANRAGGGIEVADPADGVTSAVVVTNAILGGTTGSSGNDAGTSPGNGGALHISGDGSATIADSTVSFNRANEGGGLWNSPAGTLVVNNSTLSNNLARTSTGGGIHLESGSAAPSSTNDFDFITVARNSSNGGGGITVEDGVTATLDSSLVIENSPANTSGIAGGADNLTEDTAGTIDNLQLFGGTTPTHPLLMASAALDQGNAGGCVAAPIDSLDQRGEARPIGACDQGAFERVAGDANVIAATNNRSASTVTAGDDTVVLAFGLPNSTGNDVTLDGLSGNINVNDDAGLLFNNIRVFLDVNGNGRIDANDNVQVGTGTGENGAFNVTFTGGRILADGGTENYIVVADVTCPQMVAAFVMTPMFAGGTLLGLLGLISIGGIRRRTQFGLLAVMLVLGLSACGSGGSGNGNNLGNADANLELLGDAQFSLVSVNSGDDFVVTNLPINGSGIECPVTQ